MSNYVKILIFAFLDQKQIVIYLMPNTFKLILQTVFKFNYKNVSTGKA